MTSALILVTVVLVLQIAGTALVIKKGHFGSPANKLKFGLTLAGSILSGLLALSLLAQKGPTDSPSLLIGFAAACMVFALSAFGQLFVERSDER